MLFQEHGHRGQQLPRVFHQVRWKAVDKRCTAIFSIIEYERPICAAPFGFTNAPTIHPVSLT